MITAEQVRTVIDCDVCDSDGNKIGNAKHVFLDDVTGVPEWVSVKTGLFGTGESFVPIRNASMKGDRLEVPYAKDTVKNAPAVDVDARGHLSQEEEHRLYEHYGIDWDGAWQRANQPGSKDGWAAAGGTGGTGTAAGAGTGTGTAAAAGAGVGTAAAVGAGTREKKAHADRSAAGEKMPAAAKIPAAEKGAAAENRGMTGVDAMTRSEERMHVTTERREAGRARLRKYVITEEQEQTVPLRHEEVRLEREPITEANRAAAMSGPEISEAEHEITLHAERPVTEIETVPVERVRMTTEEVTEEKTVRGQVRKEQIKAETEMKSDSDR